MSKISSLAVVVRPFWSYGVFCDKGQVVETEKIRTPRLRILDGNLRELPEGIQGKVELEALQEEILYYHGIDLDLTSVYQRFKLAKQAEEQNQEESNEQVDRKETPIVAACVVPAPKSEGTKSTPLATEVVQTAETTKVKNKAAEAAKAALADF